MMWKTERGVNGIPMVTTTEANAKVLVLQMMLAINASLLFVLSMITVFGGK